MHRFFSVNQKVDSSPGIYCITYAGLFYYVGSSMNLEGRRREHLKCTRVNSRMREVLDSHPGCSVTFRVLKKFTDRISDASLRKRESHWISKFMEEFPSWKIMNRRKMCSTTNLGTTWTLPPLTQEKRDKHSRANKKRFESPEERRKQAERLRELWEDPSYREMMLDARSSSTKRTTKAFKEALSERAKEQWRSGNINEASRKKMSEARRLYWERKARHAHRS